MVLRIAVVIALGAAAANAAASDSSITLYGLAAPLLESVGGSDATLAKPAGSTDLMPASAYGPAAAARRTRLGSNISHLGVRGAEALGAGWKVLFQLETSFPVDEARTFDFPDRNSAIGVSGPYGQLLLGLWDTPYKTSTIAYGPMRLGITQDFPTLMSNPGFGVPVLTTQSTRVGGKADAAFDRRQGNSIQYWSPVVAGLHGRLLYSTDEGRGVAATGGPVIDPEIFGASLAWGPIGRQVGVSWERHEDYFGLSQVAGSPAATAANPSSRDEAFKVFAEWRLGPVRLAGFADRIEYRNRDSAPGAIGSYRRDAINLLAQAIVGAHRPWITWTRARAGSCSRVGGDACSTAGLGATQVTAGWLYAFSKRTEAYVVAQRLENETSATYGTLPPLSGPVPGARYTAAGVGFSHFF